MYKTVRHGENSLQYTILPQTEEVLSNSGMKGKGRDYSPSIHVRRSRRKSTIKYILLVVIGIIVALALAAVPLYVMNGALYARRNHQDSHEIITGPPLPPTGREMIVKSRKKELKVTPIIVLTAEPKTEASTTSSSSTSASTTSASTTTTASTPVPSDRATTPPWTMPALRSWKNAASSTTIPPIPTENNDEIPLVGTPSGGIRLLDHYKSRKPWEDIIIRPTVTPEPMTVRSVFRYYSKSLQSEKPVTKKAFEDVLITTKETPAHAAVTGVQTTSERSKFKDLSFKDTLLSVDSDDEFKESLEVDEVFSLPPLKPETAAAAPDDEVTVSKAGDSGWYGARWPFVDTSSYFQWTDYSPGDNLLLPLLMATLTSVVLVLLLVIAIRRLKRSHAAAAQLGLTAELQEDNTNLLTAENPEDGEE